VPSNRMFSILSVFGRKQGVPSRALTLFAEGPGALKKVVQKLAYLVRFAS
jgi:hypothetical protein